MVSKVLLGVGFLLGLVALANASPAKGGRALPKNAGPVKDLGTPVFQIATAASGRKYRVWMYPPDANGLVYTVAQSDLDRTDGSDAPWVSFVYNGATDKSIPAKTNVSDAALLAVLKADWRLPA